MTDPTPAVGGLSDAEVEFVYDWTPDDPVKRREMAEELSHIIAARTEAADREAARVTAADTTALDRDEVERWADDHFTQGEVAVVMRLVDEFGWHPPRAAAVSPEGGGT